MSNESNLSVTIRGVITLAAHAHQPSLEKGKDGESLQLKTGVVTSAGVVDIPYITANSVRGMLRRAAGDVLMEELERNKEQISRNLYLSIMGGGFPGMDRDAGGATYRQLVAAQSHPFVGLFGGGPSMYSSKLRIERDLMPMVETIKDIFPPQYQADCLQVEPWNLLNKIPVAPRHDFARMPEGAFMENSVQACLGHMSAKLAGNQEKKARCAEKADGEAVVGETATMIARKSGNLVEVIVPGTRLYFGATARDLTPAQAGLLCEAIRRWANRNALGSGSVHGLGAFSAALSIHINGSKTDEHLLEGGSGRYVLTKVAEPYIAALRAQLDAGAAKPAVLGAIYPTELTMTGDSKPGRRGKAVEAVIK